MKFSLRWSSAAILAAEKPLAEARAASFPEAKSGNSSDSEKKSEVPSFPGSTTCETRLRPLTGSLTMKTTASIRLSRDGATESGGWVNLESGIPWSTVAELKRRGHDLRVDLGGFGGYQAIRWDAQNKVFHGASETGRRFL